MKKIPGYDEARPAYGVHPRLPLANYICTIVDVEAHTSKQGNPCLKIAFDIVEGDCAGFYTEQYKSDKKRDENAMWPYAGIYYVNVDSDSTKYFKGFIYCLEKSNPGFKWNWDERALKRLRFAGLFTEETGVGQDGRSFTSTRLSYVYPVDEISTMPAAYVKKPRSTNPLKNTSSEIPEPIPF